MFDVMEQNSGAKDEPRSSNNVGGNEMITSDVNGNEASNHKGLSLSSLDHLETRLFIEHVNNLINVKLFK